MPEAEKEARGVFEAHYQRQRDGYELGLIFYQKSGEYLVMWQLHMMR